MLIVMKKAAARSRLFRLEKLHVRISTPPPNKSVEGVMCKLRQGEKRYEIHFQKIEVPIRAEKPLAFMPNAAMPEQLFDICKRPKGGQKHQPIVG